MRQVVYFIGGYKASKPDIDAWLLSARKQQPSVFFLGYPYPKDASYDDDSAVKQFKKDGTFETVVKDIQWNSADKIYLVGHSSGCAIANAVDGQLTDHGNIALVSLDGFKPDKDQLARESTQVWGAMCDGKPSRNYPKEAKGNLLKRLHTYTATNCKT